MTARAKDRGSPRGVRRRRLVWRGLLLLAGVAVLVVGGRVALYRQVDDRQRVDSKRAYLERIAASRTAAERPNVVVILFDDLGYGDLGAYGGTAIRTPRVDRLAVEGLRFTQAYAAAPYCSASRAGLLTGRYAVRSAMDHVLQPAGSFYDLLLRFGGRNRRLPSEEITFAEVLSAAGYETALFGKWHLGDRAPGLPNDFGFDTFYGMLHSNDLGKPRVWSQREVVEPHPIDQTTLTRRYTERAVAFIERERERPFLLYLPHTFPHIPLHVAADRLGRSPAGLYGDVVEELDDSVGAVLDALERRGAAENTLVILSSDNGPWFSGSPGGTRGRKFDVHEGGMRVPLLVRWPDRLEAGRVVDEPVVSVDLFPTLLDLLDLPLPDDREIDGRSLVRLLDESVADEPEPIWFYQLGALRAVREGRFKYHDRHRVVFGNPMNWAWGPWSDQGPRLFDLARDPDESYDVSEHHPEIAERMRALLDAERERVAENPRGWSTR